MLRVIVMSVKAGVHEKGTFSLADGLKTIRGRVDFEKAGAIAVFVGVVRGQTVRGEQVRKLTLEAYEEKANEVLMSICDDLRKKPDIVDVQIHHLLGEFNVGEDLVYVLVAGSHRASALSVLEEAVERYKKEAPIFKKEQVATGKGARRSYWVSEGADSQS
jgi:molybdopterin synthase catalytic subunit